MSEETILIVGAGLAGAKAAETLREEGVAGRIARIGDEPELPYERPPLSKQYLTGDAPRDGAHVHPREVYAEREIDLLEGTATGIAAAEHRLALADGRVLSYARLLVATGASPRRPPIPGI